jgi:hypothetical protein
MRRLCDRLYAGLLCFCIRYLRITEAVAAVGGNHRYLRQLSAEREMLQAQLDRLYIQP